MHKKSSFRFASLAISLLTLGAASAQSTSEIHKISELAWLSGRWHTTSTRGAQIEEQWNDPVGTVMVGMGRTIVGAKTEEYEFLRIEQRETDIFYVALINGNCPPTDFKLVQLNNDEAVFANPTHDFPKRVIYRRAGPDALTASIDGGEGTKSIVFKYTRMK